ncbi:MAG: outer membrane beta-barrel protein [Bdellovibrio sp.]
MKHLKIAFIILTGFLGAQAQAVGFYFEPGVFYEKGDNDVQWPAPLNSSTGTTKGMGVDLKLGLHFDSVVFLALDGSYSKVKFENSANNYSADGNSTTYSAIVGGQFPVFGLRVWGGYVFGGALDPDKDGVNDVKFDDPKGLKLGVGFKIFVVSLNVEYMDVKYDKSRVEAPITADLDSKLHNKIGLVSVSFPMTF